MLDVEKRKLSQVSGFQVIEYIKTSVEIIMGLKLEDLEKEFNNRNLFENESHRSDFLSDTAKAGAANNLI